MKFEEILPALREGKKIRRECWAKGEYYILDKEYRLRTSKGHAVMFTTLYELTVNDWEIITEKKKVKLRDLTEKQFNKRFKNNCGKYSNCEGCLFGVVNCSKSDDNFRLKHKDLFSDKFLDQEIEVEE